MKNRKVAIFIVADNHAGKSHTAQMLQQAYETMAHYSIREIIQTEYQRVHTAAALENRLSIQQYSQSTKQQNGPGIFLHKAMTHFAQSDNDLCIIESVRAPGEAEWIQKECIALFPHITTRIIGLTAPTAERLNRFLRPRKDNIATTVTVSGFYEQEQLVNSGTQPWEENVGVTMLYAEHIVHNHDGKLSETIARFKEILLSL